LKKTKPYAEFWEENEDLNREDKFFLLTTREEVLLRKKARPLTNTQGKGERTKQRRRKAPSSTSN